MKHKRKCWMCSNIAEHEDNVVPHVLCKLCGSQDTRPLRKDVSAKRSLAAEIAVAVAGLRNDDYQGHLDAIKKQLDRFGVAHLQTEK